MSELNISQKIKSSTKWTSISMLTQTLIQFFQTMLLTKFIEPKDFGSFSIIMIIITILLIFLDLGILNRVIQNQENNKVILSSIYWLLIIMGIVLYLLLFQASPLIADFYNTEDMDKYLRITGLALLFISIGYLYQFLLQKEFLFKITAVSEIVGVLAGFSTALYLAITDRGIFALIGGYVVNNGVKYLILFGIGLKYFKPVLAFDLRQLKGYFSFGKYQVGEKLLHYITYNLDYIIIGRLLGSEILGYYNLAYQLVIAPAMKINPIITQVSFSFFSKIKNNLAMLKKAYFKTIEFIAFINIPLMSGIILLSPYFVPIVFGQNWNNSVPIIQSLGVMGLFRITNSLLPQLGLSIGNVRLTFIWTLINLMFLIPTLILGSMTGNIIIVCILLSLLQILFFIAGYFYYIKRIINATWIEYTEMLKKPVYNSLIMSIILFWLQNTLLNEVLLSNLLILTLIGIIIYFLLSIKNNKNLIIQIVSRK